MLDNFISSLKNGFRVASATRKLVFGDKWLFMYPIVATILAIIVVIILGTAGAAIYLTGVFAGWSSGSMALAFIVFLFILYFFVFFVVSYITVAMLLAFREYAKGNRISMGEALGRTGKYTSLLLKWAAFYAVIVTIIDLLETAIRSALARYGISGRILSSLFTGGINLALGAAVAFALPVIIDEKKGPVDTLKASMGFIAKNFGDTFGGLAFAEIFQIVLSLIGIGLVLLAILVSVKVQASSITLLAAITLGVLGIFLIIIGALIRYVLFNCFKLIIYDYKTKRKLPKGFNAKLIDSSVKRKKGGNKGGGTSLNTFGVEQSST